MRSAFSRALAELARFAAECGATGTPGILDRRCELRIDARAHAIADRAVELIALAANDVARRDQICARIAVVGSVPSTARALADIM